METAKLAGANGKVTAFHEYLVEASGPRLDALQQLEQIGFPGVKHEEYKFTPLTRALEKFDFTKPAPGSALPLPDAWPLRELDAYVIVMVNGRPVHGLDQPWCDGLHISPLRRSTAPGHDSLQPDAFALLNSVSWQGGLEIVVDPHVSVDKPVVIYQFADATEASVFAVTRNEITVGTKGKISVLQQSLSAGENSRFLNVVTEADVAEEAQLDVYFLQDEPGEHHQFNQARLRQKNNSRVNAYTFSLDGQLIRNNLNLILDGEGCESHMYGLYLLKGRTHVDNHTVADHQKPNSFSNELYKGIMDGQSRGVFNGKIYVRPDAQKTNAFQSNRNILLGDQSRVNTKPQLEIWADDVKCSHGCTTGQLDEEAMFYLQTRGISKKAAQAMLLYAFAGEVINAVPLPEIRLYLDRVIGQRLQ